MMVASGLYRPSGASALWECPQFEVAGFRFSYSPWISGTRSNAYFGPVSVEFSVREGRYERAERHALLRLRKLAIGKGANSLVGLEVTVDPWAEGGLLFRAGGTAADLRPIW